MKKGLKVLSLVGIAAISVGAISSLASCNKKERFYVWAAEEVVDDVQAQVEDYIATLDYVDEDGKTRNTFTDNYKLTMGSVSESEAATNLTTDVSAAASVFFFPQDQLSRLISAKVIEPVSTTYVDDVINRNDSGSLEAATAGDTLYAYPATSDNGFFVYYNATALDEWVADPSSNTQSWTAEDILADQTKLIQVAEDLGMYIAFEIGENGGWYNAAYFMAAGATSVWDLDASGKFYTAGIKDNYNSDEGLIAMKGMFELTSSDSWVCSSDASGSLNSAALVAVSGTWDYYNAIEALANYTEGGKYANGCELGCAPLWSYTVDGTSYQLGCFSGFKLVGTKPENDATKNALAQGIANYITDYACQKDRLDRHGWGPSNLAAQEEIDYDEQPQLKAFYEQIELKSIPQGNYPDDWWNWAAALGAGCLQAKGTPEEEVEAKLQALLDTYTSSLNDYKATL